VGFSAVPQVAPISRALRCSQELLDLGTCLPAALARRLLVLHNAAAAPLHFVWDLGVFDEERGAISGRLVIVPATGGDVVEHAGICVSWWRLHLQQAVADCRGTWPACCRCAGANIVMHVHVLCISFD
jgi:hypothetical protein